MGRMFGTDGVRGIANTELTAESAYDSGRSRSLCINRQEHIKPKILVAKDTRISRRYVRVSFSSWYTFSCEQKL